MNAPAPGAQASRQPRWSPWRTVVAFGAVSLAGDMVYEGMRSIAARGPQRSLLVPDHPGLPMTAVCVPLLAVAPFEGSVGLALAATLIPLERAGKAIRSPSKSALLARVAVSVGRGRGFAVHKALDQGALQPFTSVTVRRTPLATAGDRAPCKAGRT